MNRRGMALPLALIALLLVTGLATASLTVARLKMAGGTRRLAARRAFEAARGSVDRHAADWDGVVARGLAVGGMVPLSSAYSRPGLATFDSLLRLGSGLYAVRSRAVARAGGSVIARDGVSRLVRVNSPPSPADSVARALLAAWVLQSSRDNVVMVPGVSFITNGWSRLP